MIFTCTQAHVQTTCACQDQGKLNCSYCYRSKLPVLWCFGAKELSLKERPAVPPPEFFCCARSKLLADDAKLLPALLVIDPEVIEPTTFAAFGCSPWPSTQRIRSSITLLIPCRIFGSFSSWQSRSMRSAK